MRNKHRLSKEKLEAEARRPRKVRKFGWQSPTLEAQQNKLRRLPSDEEQD